MNNNHGVNRQVYFYANKNGMRVVVRSGSGASLYEQKYAKQIALLIDNSELGTFISLDVGDMNEFIEKRDGLRLNVDCEIYCKPQNSTELYKAKCISLSNTGISFLHGAH